MGATLVQLEYEGRVLRKGRAVRMGQLLVVLGDLPDVAVAGTVHFANRYRYHLLHRQPA